MTILERHIAWRRRALRGVFAVFAAGALALCCVSCVNDRYEQTRFPDGESIALQVSMFDIIEDKAAPDVELMHNLRVIITHKEGEKEVIEYNRFIDFNDTKGKYRYGYIEDPRLMFKIERGTAADKHIYLFANSEPIFDKMLAREDLRSLGQKHPDPEDGIYGGSHYEAIKPDIADTYLKALKDVTFTNTELQEFVKPEGGGPANGLPMSAEYDITFSPGNTGVADVHIMDAYIVRAANKITFTYINDRLLGDIAVTKWELHQTADKSWLLPHVPADKGKNLSFFGAGTEYGGDWITWYADHIKSEAHLAELDFDAPEGVVMSPFSASYEGSSEFEKGEVKETVTGLRVPQRSLSESDPTPVDDPVTYYFLESRNVSGETDEQSYAMVFETSEYSETPSNEKHWLGARYPAGSGTYPLDMVKTLLRNTHVKITATFADKGQVNLDVSVINWIVNDPVEGKLEPE